MARYPGRDMWTPQLEPVPRGVKAQLSVHRTTFGGKEAVVEH